MYAIILGFDHEALKRWYAKSPTDLMLTDRQKTDLLAEWNGLDPQDPALLGAGYRLKTYLSSKNIQHVQDWVWIDRSGAKHEQYAVYRILAEFASTHAWFLECVSSLRLVEVAGYSPCIIKDLKEDV